MRKIRFSTALRLEPLEARQLLAADVMITEFLADNEISIEDEAGHREDWIELFNAGDAPASMAGWYLTDDPSDLTKWRLPRIEIDPQQFLIVFASNKDQIKSGLPLHTNFKLSAEGDYLALVHPDGRTVANSFGPNYRAQLADVSYGIAQATETIHLVPERAPATALVVTSDSGAGSLGLDWTQVDFDDATWQGGQAGLGYENGTGYQSYIGLDVKDAMFRQTAGAYLRIPFEVTDVSDLATLSLKMRYDDGFAAYLNGTLIAKRNVPEPLTFRSTASSDRPDAQALVAESIDLSGYFHLLQPGRNVLAIHGLNSSASNDDFLIFPELVAERAGAPDPHSLRYFTTPTPGGPNGEGVTDVGTILTHVEHTPQEAAFDQPLHVTADVLPGASGVQEMKLTYRSGSGRSAQNVTIPMFDDGQHGDGEAGDNRYGVDIPAGIAPPSEIIRYSFTVVDSSGASSPWPRADAANDRELNYGTIVADPSIVSNLPVMYMFLQNPSGADGDIGTRGAIYYNGVLYDNVFVNIHGQSSRGFPKKSYNVDFARDNRFQPFADSDYSVKDINLLSNYADKSKLRNTLAYETYADAGAVTHFAFPVRVQRGGAFYGIYDLVEDGDDDYLGRNGLDPFGALYKMYNTFNAVTDAEKKTRRDEGTADLGAFQAGLRQSGQALTRFLYDNVDIPGMVNYLAAMIMTGNVDCCHKNYYAYRDTLGNGEWTYLPWDLDLSFGRNWTSSRNYFDDGLYSQNPLYIGRGNLLIDALFNDSAFNQMYLRRLRTQMDELLQTADVPEAERHYENRIDELIAEIGDDAALDNAKWGVWGTFPTWEQQLSILRDQYLAERRNYLFVTQSGGRGPIPAAQAADVAVEITAVEYAPESGNRDEQFIQLRAPGRGQTVDISGWRIEGSVQHTFKAGTVLTGGSLYLTRDSKAFRARTTGPSGNQGLFVQDAFEGVLPASGGAIRLVDKDGREVATFSYAGEPSLAQQFLRVTELNYHPHDPAPTSAFDDNDFEFIELANTGDVPLDLAGVQFTAGIEYDFTESPITQLAPGQRLVIVANEAAFRERYGNGPVVAGMYNGSLSNSGELLTLVDADGVTILNFAYRDSWYPETDGDGATLVIADALAATDAWGQKAGWNASRQQGGTPGLDDGQLIGDADRDGDVDLADLQTVRDRFGSSPADLGDADYDGDVDLDDLNTVRNYFGTLTPIAVVAPESFTTAAPASAGADFDRARDVVFGLFSEAISPFDRRGRRR